MLVLKMRTVVNAVLLSFKCISQSVPSYLVCKVLLCPSFSLAFDDGTGLRYFHFFLFFGYENYFDYGMIVYEDSVL